MTARTVQVQSSPAVNLTESWAYEDQWLKAHQLVHSDQTNRLFRTEFTFYRNGLREGQPGYLATDPITISTTDRSLVTMTEAGFPPPGTV